jgi:hypothetical protein
MVYR